jgi:hypothetical protein
MKHLDDRTAANLDVVLEDVCSSLPHGGDHVFRKKIAQKLLSAVRRGNTTLASLTGVARSAMTARTAKRRSIQARPD